MLELRIWLHLKVSLCGCAQKTRKKLEYDPASKVRKLLREHVCVLFHSHVYNVALEANRVEKKCEEGFREDSVVIEARGPWSPAVATPGTATHHPCQRRGGRTTSWEDCAQWEHKLGHSWPTSDFFNGKSLLWGFLQASLRLSQSCTAIWSSSYPIPSFLRCLICINHDLKVFPACSYSVSFLLQRHPHPHPGKISYS